MSFSPTLSLVRLQELKQWQGSFEDLLQSKTKGQIQDVHKEVDHSAPFTSSGNLDKTAKKKAEEWDTRKISPAKPFAQLLEEKLAEDHPIAVKDKPKKPFLRKGEGLARFRMAPLKKTGMNFTVFIEISKLLLPSETTAILSGVKYTLLSKLGNFFSS